ncbi:MAG: c-type cytochrome [Syntrophobacteraceae bacterium]
MLKKAIACGAIVCLGIGYAALARAADPSAATGKTLYTANCTICHGADGKGQGPAAMSLTPKPQDFTSKQFWQTPNIDTAVLDQIKNGKGQMPAFPNLSKDEDQSILLYLKQAFQPK